MKESESRVKNQQKEMRMGVKNHILMALGSKGVRERVEGVDGEFKCR